MLPADWERGVHRRLAGLVPPAGQAGWATLGRGGRRRFPCLAVRLPGHADAQERWPGAFLPFNASRQAARVVE